MYLVKMMKAKALWDSNRGDCMHHHCPIGSTIVNRCTDAGSLQFETDKLNNKIKYYLNCQLHSKRNKIPTLRSAGVPGLNGTWHMASFSFWITILGGATCEEVSTTTCGSVNTLTSGQSVTTQSENYPSNYDRENCAYLFKGPSSGHSLKINIDSLSLPTTCAHVLSIKNNAVGQQAVYLWVNWCTSFHYVLWNQNLYRLSLYTFVFRGLTRGIRGIKHH